MKIITDTNVLMAGLLKDSIVREILLTKKIDFYVPEKGIAEIKKYKEELCAKAGYTHMEFDTLLSSILERVNLVPQADIKKHMEKAEEIMRVIDIEDSPFIAASYAVDADGIWSFDAHFKRQKVVRFFDTKKLLALGRGIERQRNKRLKEERIR